MVPFLGDAWLGIHVRRVSPDDIAGLSAKRALDRAIEAH